MRVFSFICICYHVMSHSLSDLSLTCRINFTSYSMNFSMIWILDCDLFLMSKCVESFTGLSGCNLTLITYNTRSSLPVLDLLYSTSLFILWACDSLKTLTSKVRTVVYVRNRNCGKTPPPICHCMYTGFLLFGEWVFIFNHDALQAKFLLINICVGCLECTFSL